MKTEDGDKPDNNQEAAEPRLGRVLPLRPDASVSCLAPRHGPRTRAHACHYFLLESGSSITN